MKQAKPAGLTDRRGTCNDEPMIEFEQRLRTDARLALEQPQPHLRERTLVSLRAQPMVMATTRRPWAMPALAACLFMAFSGGIAALMLAPQPKPTSSETVVESSLTFSLPKSGTPALGGPLITEARLLARDAQRTFARFKEGLPSPPKFSRVEPGANSAS